MYDQQARPHPVFLTSHSRPEELLSRLEERVIERLRECATGLEVTGPNLRDGTVERRNEQRQHQGYGRRQGM